MLSKPQMLSQHVMGRRGSPQSPLEKVAFFRNALLGWWQDNRRSFPWRERNSLYEVAVAEVLLRKTSAKQAERVYEQLLQSWPEPCRLASADEEDLARILTPLGIYRERARLLKALGEALCRLSSPSADNQKLPLRDILMKIPGLGPYATNMILATLCDAPAPGLDRNFIRIIQRVFDMRPRRKRPHTDPDMWRFAETLMPERGSRELNWAILDFGALICKPKPICQQCPLTTICAFYQSTSKPS